MTIPRKLQHTPGAHPRQSPYPTMKGFPLQPVGKGCSGCVPFRCVETTLEPSNFQLILAHILSQQLSCPRWFSPIWCKSAPPPPGPNPSRNSKRWCTQACRPHPRSPPSVHPWPHGDPNFRLFNDFDLEDDFSWFSRLVVSTNPSENICERQNGVRIFPKVPGWK